jgi:hypothetical protein
MGDIVLRAISRTSYGSVTKRQLGKFVKISDLGYFSRRDAEARGIWDLNEDRRPAGDSAGVDDASF